ncbi:hypothetical protein GCM10018779_67420 [Streptomyces griseocarneus]|nr:hypothetical protein GCM10018779_67420 [Streptomyces griseocarneus]
MDRVRSGLGRRGEDLGHVQIAGGGGLTTQRVRLVGRPDMQRVTIRIGIDRHTGDPRVPARTSDTDSDFATIGDQHLTQAHFSSFTLRSTGTVAGAHATGHRPGRRLVCRQ